jgi:glucose/arabinose dehydrogenase
LVASGFVSPTWGTFAPGDDRHLYVADQPGQLWEITLPSDRGDHDGARATTAPRMILDLSGKMVKVGLFPPLNYDERGFLGIAFHPHFRRNGLFYTFTSDLLAGKADFSTVPSNATPNCQTVIREWRAINFDTDDGGLNVDLSSARELLRIDKPEFNHNGGTLAFGPDAMLYISVGDGGAANDAGSGHVAGGNAQSLAMNNALGKILRIDPLGHDSANGQYGIPEDNPFAMSHAGPGEIWAYGFRNPFRMSFDRETGELFVGDVGQNNIEEVDGVRKGGNYGWPVKEGTFLFDQTNGGVYADSPGSPAGLIDPIAEYDHADGVPPAPDVRVAVIGGNVYRGHEIRDLRGRYLFGDYSGAIGTPVNGHLFTLGRDGIEDVRVAGRTPLGLAVLSFGQDERGELYLLANHTGTLNGKTGEVYLITGTRHGGRHDD